MRLKCPGCGTWLCDDEELNDDGDEVPIEMEHIAGGRWTVTEIVHAPARCRTASGVAALVDAARGADACIEKLDAAIWDAHYGKGISADYARERHATAEEALTALRAALGALR